MPVRPASSRKADTAVPEARSAYLKQRETARAEQEEQIRQKVLSAKAGRIPVRNTQTPGSQRQPLAAKENHPSDAPRRIELKHKSVKWTPARDPLGSAAKYRPTLLNSARRVPTPIKGGAGHAPTTPMRKLDLNSKTGPIPNATPAKTPKSKSTASAPDDRTPLDRVMPRARQSPIDSATPTKIPSPTSGPAHSIMSPEGKRWLQTSGEAQTGLRARVTGWQEKLEDKERPIPEQWHGSIHLAIGQAQLLMKEKFVQFEDLCRLNIEPDEDQPEARSADLASYWDVMNIQTKAVIKRFDRLVKAEHDGWPEDANTPVPETKVKPASRLHAKNKPVKLNNNALRSQARDRIAEARRLARERMQKLQQQKQEDDDFVIDIATKSATAAESAVAEQPEKSKAEAAADLVAAELAKLGLGDGMENMVPEHKPAIPPPPPAPKTPTRPTTAVNRLSKLSMTAPVKQSEKATIENDHMGRTRKLVAITPKKKHSDLVGDSELVYSPALRSERIRNRTQSRLGATPGDKKDATQRQLCLDSVADIDKDQDWGYMPNPAMR
eukprot:Clim_evm12s168 gene=Clim_evmTU12s168